MTVGTADAACDAAEPTTARSWKRPMWLTFQTARKVPSDWTCVVAVTAQRSWVSRPRRSIFTVCPDWPVVVVPLTTRRPRRTVEARLAIDMPSPLALTTVLAGWLEGAELDEELGARPPPPVAAKPIGAKANAADTELTRLSP